MTLSQERNLYVSDFMSTPAIAIGLESSFTDAVKLMAAKNIGNLVIFADDVARGILTEREILRYLATRKGIPDIKVKDVLCQKFVPISSGMSVLDAAKTMISKGARLLVFKRESSSHLDQLAGIITASDLMRAFLQTDRNPTIEATMSKNVVTVKPIDSILYSVKLMFKKRIGSVVVVEKGEPLGLFSERDLLGVVSKKVDIEEKIGSYISRPIVTANIGIGAKQAGRIMIDHKIKRLPLERGDKLAAIVTTRDVVEAFQSRM